MTITSYPPYRPSEIVYTAGDFAVSLRKYVDVVEYPDLLANLEVGAMLELRYDNINDEVAKEYIDAFGFSLSGFLAIQLSRQMFGGMIDKRLTQLLVNPIGVDWHYMEEPKVRAVSLGISTIGSIKLITKIKKDISCLTPCSAQLNARGGFLWVQRFNSAVYQPNYLYDPGAELTYSADGSRVYVAFAYWPLAEAASTGYLLVACFDKDGVHQWSRQLTPIIFDSPAGNIRITPTPNGVAVAVDRFNPFFGPQQHRIFHFAKSDGALLWQTQIAATVYIWCLRYLPASDVIVLGCDDRYIRFNRLTGAFLSAKQFTVSGNTRIYDIREDSNGKVLVCGMAFGPSPRTIFIMRLDSTMATYDKLIEISDSGGSEAEPRIKEFGGAYYVISQRFYRFNSNLGLDFTRSIPGALGWSGLDIDTCGVIYLSANSPLPYPISNIPYPGGFTSGHCFTMNTDATVSLSSSASQAWFDTGGGYGYFGDKQIHAGSNRTASVWSNQSSPANTTAIVVVSNSISFPSEVKTLLIDGTRSARYVGDCSPVQPTSIANTATVTDRTWTLNTVTPAQTTPSFTANDVTGTVSWALSSKTL
jgi:hypothetical protein